MNLVTYVIACCSIVAACYGTPISTAPQLESYFSQEGVKGTFVLYDPAVGKLVVYNPERAQKQFQPASTFKIVNALIALDVGAVKSLDEVIPYGNTRELLKIWEKDMNLKDAMRFSNVAVFHMVARQVGLQTFKAKLAEFDYGNKDTGNTMESRFWLTGPLAISAIEQAEFLHRLTEGKLPISRQAIELTSEILLQEKTENYSLYAKTGWVGPDDPQIGWWVGWIIHNSVTYPFALNIDILNDTDAPKRISIGKSCLGKLLHLDMQPNKTL